MKINKRHFIIFISILILIFTSILSLFYIYAKEKKHLFFFSISPIERSDIKVNSEIVFNDKYDDKSKDIYPITINSLYPNSISVKWQTQKIKIKDINKNDFINIHVIYLDKWKIKRNTYKLYMLPSNFPGYSIQNNGLDYGMVLISLPVYSRKTKDDNKKFTYALIMDTNGKLLFSRVGYKNTQFNIRRWHTPNNKVFYSIFQKYLNDPIRIYFGEYFIFDSKFNLIDKVNIIETEKHITVDTDQHDMIMLGENHYLLFGYTYTNVKNMLLFDTVIQELKDGKIIFDWKSSDHIDYSKMNYASTCHYYACDPMHINSISIDPKDNNLIVSFRHTNNIMKINRENGNIMWKLGGYDDDYNLTIDESFCMQHSPQYYNDEFYMFDNSCPYKSKNPEDNKSRILKLKLDEQQHKIINKDEYSLNEYIQIGGSIQFIDDDKMMIGCGSSNNCNAFVINMNDKKVLWKLEMDKPYNNYGAQYQKI